MLIVTSVWVQSGECNRGEECPYRHEKPTDPDDPLSDQNIRDRYYGTNDPVADKLLRRANAMPTLTTPEDKSITTLYIGNIGEFMTEQDLRDHFYQFGEIRSISIVPKQQCAFVQYTTRAAAEVAAEKSFNKLILLGRRLTVRWGKGQGQKKETTTESLPPVPGLPVLPLVNNYFNLGGGSSASATATSSSVASSSVTSSAPDVLPPGLGGGVYYPSMDPLRMGGGGAGPSASGGNE